MQKILFLGSNPEPSVQLDLMRQFTDIQSSVYASPLRAFTLELAYADVGDFVKLLHDQQPAILHFTGHATKAGLAMEASEPAVLMVPLNVIADVLTALPVPPRCLVLNACDTGEPPRALQEAVDFVIGMKGAVRQSSAITFADTFYSTLARGTSIGRAFELAKNAMEMAHPAETATPRLLGRLSERAWTSVLTGEPALAAEFLMDRPGLPRRKGKYFDVRLSIRNAPSNAYMAVYQLTDDYRTGEFEKVDSGQRDFELFIDYWEDFEVKVVLWSPEGGVCLKRRVLDALRDEYPHPSDAMDQLLKLMVTA